MNVDDAVVLAKYSIEHGLKYKSVPSLDLRKINGGQQIGFSYVTITNESDQVIGCRGDIARYPYIGECIADSICTSAFNAAFNDKRYPAVTNEVLARSKIQVSLLNQHCKVVRIQSYADFQCEPETSIAITAYGQNTVLLAGTRSVFSSDGDMLMALMNKASLPLNTLNSTSIMLIPTLESGRVLYSDVNLRESTWLRIN